MVSIRIWVYTIVCVIHTTECTYILLGRLAEAEIELGRPIELL
jgi:hypothetical protein